MRPVHWVIQENQGEPSGVRAILESLESDGHVSHLVWLSKGTDIPVIPDLPDGVPVVCYGPAFVPRALHHPRLRAGLFFDPEKFRWSVFRDHWAEDMLSGDGRLMTLSEAQEFLLSAGTAFIRPDSDSKVFDGSVYDSGRLSAATKNLDPITSVVVATPVTIEAEWRFFIVNANIVGCSEYRRAGRVSTSGSIPQEAIELVSDLASRWSPAAVYCLDLGATAHRMGVLEANCFNASRFYGAPTARVLKAVNGFVQELFRRTST